MLSSSPLVDRLVMAASAVISGGSLLLFGAFLWWGPVELVTLPGSALWALIIDAALSLAFFVQHSGMVRLGFRERSHARIPEHLGAAGFSISSGLVLLAVMALWQPTGVTLASADGPLRWVIRGLFVLAALGGWWGVAALGPFDGLGLRKIRAHLKGREPRELPLRVRGPYRWVRHPLYVVAIVMIWATPDLTADRLLFNVLWTAWVVAGARLEEQDMVETFGDAYRRYQQAVPMLLPYRRPRAGE